jgi:outer membrane protein assembly factor BamD
MIEDRSWPQRYFHVDISSRDPGAALKAYDDFALLINQYPTSAYAADAKQRMIYLRNTFAQGEVNVAKYYYIRHAYIAAANRGSYVLQHYNGTSATEEALGIMVLSYRALGQNAEAQKAQQMLDYNYPHSTVLRSLQKI